MMQLLSVTVLFLSYGATQDVGNRCTQNGVSGVYKRPSDCASSTDFKFQIDVRMASANEVDGDEDLICCIETPAESTTVIAPVTKSSRLVTEATATSTELATEATTTENPIESLCAPLPERLTARKIGEKAWDKCIEYQRQLVYPCERSVALIGGYNRVNNCKHSAITSISGGSIAHTDEFPHMVQLGFALSKDSPVSSAMWSCSGTLISDWFILTAGHCTSKPTYGQSNVTHYIVTFAAIGSLQNQKRSISTRNYSKIYNIDKIIKHPEFKPPVKYNDIALLKTAKRMTLGPSAVPACLDVFGGDRSTAVATGWGSTITNDTSYILQKVTLNQASYERCRQKNPSFRLMLQGVNDTIQLCYGHETRNADTCEGDSGGPLTIRNPKIDCMYSMIGIVGHARGFGIPGLPGIYTKVSHFVPWIESIVWPDEVSNEV